MTNQEQLAQLEREAKSYKAAIDLGSALEKLMSNRDFNRLITEGYLRNEAVRLVQARSNPELQSPEKQAANLRDIDAIGSLSQFFNTVRAEAGMAGRSLKSNEETQAELLAEGN